MSRFGMKKGEPILHPWLNTSIAKAQTKVEERNFEIRKHLLEYDDVLNEQRKFIYARRDEIISDPHLSERVVATGEELWAEMFEKFVRSGENRAAKTAALLAELRESLFYDPPESPEELAALTPDELDRTIRAALPREHRAEIRRDRRGAAQQVHPLRVPAQHRFPLAGPPREPRGAARGGVPARVQPEEPAARVQAGRLPDLRPDALRDQDGHRAEGLQGQDREGARGAGCRCQGPPRRAGVAQRDGPVRGLIRGQRARGRRVGSPCRDNDSVPPRLSPRPRR